MLKAALAAEDIDFLALFSSVTALSGGVGQVDYCAANAFLDAFAQSEALAALFAALGSEEPQVHVATRDLAWLLSSFGSSTGDSVLKELEQVDGGADRSRFATREYEAPGNAVEAELAEIWQELLGVSPIGRQDNFFDLGGHSLLAVQIVSRIREKYQIELAMSKLFEVPTVAELAQFVSEAQVQSVGLDEMERLLLEIEQMNS